MNFKTNIAFWAIISILIVFGNTHNTILTKDITSKKHKTPKELKAETIKMKSARRSSGWAKPDKPSAFSLFHERIRTKYGTNSPGYKPNYRFTALNKAINEAPALKSTTALNWIERGPGNISGRTRGLLIDPDDATGNTWFAGSVGGGIWKTTNAGGLWINLTPNLPVLSTVCLAMAKSNTKIIYAGTGEGYFNGDAIIGDGIFKSTDKGTTWTQLTGTAENTDFNYVNRIIVDPSNENIVLAATNTSLQKSTDGGLTWKSVYAPNGRVQQIIENPKDFSIQLATVYGSGIIKSTDAGNTWRKIFSNKDGRIELAFSPTNPNIVYALTQESNLWVSYDSGENFTSSSITSGTKDVLLSSQGWYNNTLAVSPNDTNMVLIGGVNIYQIKVTGKSKVATTSINVRTVNTEPFMDFIDHGGNYMDGAMEISTNIKSYNTIEVRFGPGKKQKAHRFEVPEGSTSGVPDESYSYIDYVEVPFEVWDPTTNRQFMVSFRDQDRNGVFNLTPFDDSSFRGREYIYINDVSYSAASNPSIAKLGGHKHNEIAFWWPVLANGATWNPQKISESKIIIERKIQYPVNLSSTKIADWTGDGAAYVHADLHNVQYVKTNKNVTRIVATNDGGLAYSDDLGKTWKNPANGYNTTQFYGIDKHPTQNKYLGGMQDNGSWFSPSSPDKLSVWAEATGGDGFDAVWNAADPKKMITSIYNNKLWISYNEGESWSVITNGLTDLESKAPFITQIGYHPSDPDKLFLSGSSGVTYSENFGKNWNVTKIPSSTWGWEGDSYVEPSIACPDVVWAAAQLSNSGFIHVSQDGGKSFKATSGYSEPMGTLSGLATHPVDENTAYALFSFAGMPKILRTTNLGNSWEDITGFKNGKSTNGFPDVATYSLLVMPNNTNEIWAGTEIGLFISMDNGSTWYLSNNGLPNTSIWEMKIRGNQVIIATHGRGVFTADIPELAKVTKAPILESVAKSPSNGITIKHTITSLYDSLTIMIDNTPVANLPADGRYPTSDYFSMEKDFGEGTHSVQLIAYKKGITYKSVKKYYNEFELLPPSHQYVNLFDTNNNDFIGTGFSITSHPALNDGMAIHTTHPYEENIDIYYLLKQPIIVRKDHNINKANFSYWDIAFVEEGEPGATYLSEDFYDFVIVEGSKNGVDWLPLLDGYDFSLYKIQAKTLNKNIDSTPTSDLFIKHHTDLLKTFSEGDTILIRFKLHSDPFSTGWGWVIDNINIQGTVVNNFTSTKTVGNIIYPNPCNNELNINLIEEFSKNASITVYDLSGKVVKKEITHSTAKIQLNTAYLKPNNYLLEISNGEKYQQIKFSVIH